MNHLERFFATIERKPVDRPASWLGLPTTQARGALFDYFRVNSEKELIEVLDTDVYAVEMPYHSPESNAIYTALNFAKSGTQDESERTLTAPGFLRITRIMKKLTILTGLILQNT